MSAERAASAGSDQGPARARADGQAGFAPRGAADQVRGLCQQRGQPLCAKLADQYAAEEAPDQSLVADLRRGACDGGDEASCTILARLYASGTGVPRDEQRALQAHDRPLAMSAKELEACGNNPWCDFARAALPIVAERERAALAPGASESECEAGSLHACSLAVHAFMHSDPVKEAHYRAKLEQLWAQTQIGR